nr:SWI/SNF-related matrix-associated actin-dependent regulator of chromatin subfamily A-like protein 1 isoform X2 [Ipomoea batatas]
MPRLNEPMHHFLYYRKPNMRYCLVELLPCPDQLSFLNSWRPCILMFTRMFTSMETVIARVAFLEFIKVQAIMKNCTT